VYIFEVGHILRRFWIGRAVPETVTLPGQLVQPVSQLAGLDEDIDEAVCGPVAQPSLDDLSGQARTGPAAAARAITPRQRLPVWPK